MEETDLINMNSEKNNNNAIQHTASNGFDQNQGYTKSQKQVFIYIYIREKTSYAF